jgi:gliding motility-associated-like protein
VNGNSDSAIAVVTVSDTTPTIAIAQDITVYLDGTGNVTILPADVDNGSADNCGTVTLTLDSTNFDCSEVGANNVKLFVTDASSNLDSATAVVTVVDTLKPIVVAQPITVFLDASGNASITTTDIDNGTTDNCNLATLALNTSAFTCADIGTNNIQLIATDVNGNIDSASAIVTVNDTLRPIVVTQSIAVFLDASGNASITTADIDNGTADNCTIATLALSSSIFTCANVGANNVQLIATDVNGNIDSASVIVTVNDTVAPSAVAQNITVYLDGTGNVSILPGDIDNGSADNCGTVTLALDSTNFDCSEVGGNNVKLFVTDADANVDSASAVVTVLDTLKPIVIAQPITVFLDAFGNASITTADIDNGSFDNCGTITLALDSTNFDCSEVGANTVKLFVTDANTNVDSATAVVTVVDTLNPTVIVQNITAYLDATGNTSITSADIDNGSTDNCGTVTLALDSTSFDCSEVGVNTVKLFVTDASSNIDSATAVVTVVDTINPTVITQNITAYLDATGNVNIAPADIDNGSTDNCGTVTLVLDSTNFDCSEVGANTVTLFVTDANSNVDSATAVVTVLDTLNPTIITQNVTIYLDAAGSASITTTNIDNGSFDNCGTITLALDSTNFDCSEVGANTVKLFVTDANANIDSATAVVTVVDTLNPTVITQNITVYLDATGSVSINPGDIDNGSTDNCGTITLALDSANFDCSELGANTVTLIVTDANTNVDSATAVVTVLDTLNPTVITQNITAYLDATGNVNIAPTDIDNGSTDNCGTVTLVLDSTNFDCSEVGANTVTLFVTDANSNVDSATAVVTVLDTLNPTIITQNVTIYLDAAGSASITTTDIDNGSFDNCGTITLALDSASFDCSEVGANTVTLFVTDANSNVDSATAIVTVVDTIIPVITCIADTVICDAVFTFSTPIGTDNCAIQSIVQTTGIPSGASYPVGTTINTFVVTDVNGNVDSCSFIVTREDFPTIAAAGLDVNICVDTFNLNANVPIVGVGSWSTTTNGVTFDNNFAASTTVRNLVRGENVLIWAISNGVCNSSLDTIIVTYDNEPTPAFAGNDQTLCDVYEISLGGNNPTIGSGNWTLNIGNGNITNSSASNTFVSNLGDGLNQFVWTTSNGTCNDSFDTVNITVSKSPVVDAGPDRTIFQDDGTILSAVVTPDSLNNQTLIYQWQPSFFLDDPAASSTTTISSFNENTEFTVEVTSEQGCIGRDTAIVFVRALLEIPTSFTPNGDGINDVWEIKNFEQYAKMRVIVYDPLGSEVYSTSNYDYWDGRRNGNELPVTSYHYIITVTDFSGKTEALSGIVTILR